MSILWCGGEDIDLESYFGAPTTSDIYFRPDFARCAFSCDGSGRYFKTIPLATPVSTLWFSCQIYLTSLLTINTRLVGLSKSGTNAWIGLGVGGASSVLSIIKHDGTTNTVLASASGTSTTGLHSLDIKVENYGSSGVVTVYLDDVQIITYSGNIATLGQTTLDQVWGLRGGINTYCYVSEIILADEDTRLLSLKTLAPNAAGDTSDWTNGYANIDEVTNSDADTVYSGTADQEFQCNLTGMPAGDYICKAVKVAARMTDGVGGMDVQMGVRTNSTTSLGSAVGIDSVWKTYETLYQSNPVTSNRFTPEEIEALQLAFKSVAV